MSDLSWRTCPQWQALAVVGLFFSSAAVFCIGQCLIPAPPGPVLLLLSRCFSPSSVRSEASTTSSRYPLRYALAEGPSHASGGILCILAIVGNGEPQLA